ncbi:MAG: hypothetical protein IPH69_17630 [Bacteroidales bacterium]|nr:hypothetical protein [Bacteroidales bacterium]
MTGRLKIYILLLLSVSVTGCIKETYDMNKLSDELHLSPTFAIAGAKGEVSFSDLVKSGDTVIFDQDNFVRVVFKQDSVINLQLADLFDLEDMVSFTKSYKLGVLSIGSIQGAVSLTLNQITQSMSTALRNQIRALDDGTTTFSTVSTCKSWRTLFERFPEF